MKKYKKVKILLALPDSIYYKVVEEIKNRNKGKVPYGSITKYIQDCVKNNLENLNE